MGPWLILLKGHPCSGKSTIAKRLAKDLSCALIDKDDAKSVLLQELSNILDDAALNSLSYQLMVQSARTQLEAGVNCIVDCPLARKSLFDELYTICTQVSSITPTIPMGINIQDLQFHGKVALIECVAEDLQIWRYRVEERAKRLKGTIHQHKAFAWDELHQLIKQYNVVFTSLLQSSRSIDGVEFRYDGCWTWTEELASGVLAYYQKIDTTSDDQHRLQNAVAQALRKCSGQ